VNKLEKSRVNSEIRKLQREYHRICKIKDSMIELKELRKLDDAFYRVFMMDERFNHMNVESVRFIFRYNLLRRVIPFHILGQKIEIGDALCPVKE